MQNLRITNKRLLDRPRPQNSVWQCSILGHLLAATLQQSRIISCSLWAVWATAGGSSEGPDEQVQCRTSARPVQRPGQHILSHAYAALYAPMRSTYGVHSDLVLSERRLGGPLLQLRSRLQLSPWVQRSQELIGVYNPSGQCPA